MTSVAVKTGIKIGLLTAAAILLFQLSALAFVYRYFKFEYYLTAIAVIFLAGGYYLAQWKSNSNRPIIQPNPLNLLTVKELQIFEEIMAGKSNKEIAATHFVELSTIKTHINNLYGKLGVGSRKELRGKFDGVVS